MGTFRLMTAQVKVEAGRVIPGGRDTSKSLERGPIVPQWLSTLATYATASPFAVFGRPRRSGASHGPCRYTGPVAVQPKLPCNPKLRRSPNLFG